jgi:hypothetical protein
MDDGVPTIDFSTSGGSIDDSKTYSLERADVDGRCSVIAAKLINENKRLPSDLIHLMDELERFAQTLDPVAVETVKETRLALDKLIAKMDGLEAGFDRIVERSCSYCLSLDAMTTLIHKLAVLSSSRLISSRRRSVYAFISACLSSPDKTPLPFSH